MPVLLVPRLVQEFGAVAPHLGVTKGKAWLSGVLLPSSVRAGMAEGKCFQDPLSSTESREPSVSQQMLVAAFFLSSGKSGGFSLASLPRCPPSRAGASVLLHLPIFGRRVLAFL